jgi:Icc-related predicted phosphoesterase
MRAIGRFVRLTLCRGLFYIPRAPANHPQAQLHDFGSASHEKFNHWGLGTVKKPFTVYKNHSHNPNTLVDSTATKNSAGSEGESKSREERKAEKKLRCVCISDTHNHIDKLEIPAGDVLIHTGDAVKYRSSALDLVKFNEFMGTLPHNYKLFIPGNHETSIDHEQFDAAQKILSNMTLLIDRTIEIEGISFHGCSWKTKRGVAFRAEAFSYPEHKIQQDKYAKIPSNIDILLTHPPPYSVRDWTMGSAELLNEVLTRIQPLVHVSGHIHEPNGASLFQYKENQELLDYCNTANSKLEWKSEKEKNVSVSPDREILFINAAIYLSRAHLHKPIVFDVYY